MGCFRNRKTPTKEGNSATRPPWAELGAYLSGKNLLRPGPGPGGRGAPSCLWELGSLAWDEGGSSEGLERGPATPTLGPQFWGWRPRGCEQLWQHQGQRPWLNVSDELSLLPEAVSPHSLLPTPLSLSCVELGRVGREQLPVQSAWLCPLSGRGAPCRTSSESGSVGAWPGVCGVGRCQGLGC